MNDIQNLPVVGVGASLSFGVPPDPVSLAQMRDGPDFVEYAGSVDAMIYQKEIRTLHEQKVPTLFHPSCLNLCGPWSNPKQWLEAVQEHVQYVRSPWLAQDVSVCFVEEPGYSIQLGYFVGPILSKESLEQAVQRVLEVRSIVSVPLLLEPPPATWRIGDMSMMEWLNELALRTGCGLLIDSGHIYAHCLVEKRNLLSDIDFSRVVEIHVAGGSIGVHNRRKYYTDDHRLPIQPEVWAVFDKLVASSPNLKAVCYECEGASAASVLPVLQRVRHRVLQNTQNEELRQFVVDRIDHKPKSEIQDPTVASKAPKSLPVQIDAGYTHVLRLLFDANLRELLHEDPVQCAQDLGCEEVFLQGLDATGLDIDAKGRSEYLMSSLCRLFPWSTSIIGSSQGGADALQQFLSSPVIFGDMDARNDQFAEHLKRILSFRLIPSFMVDAVRAFVDVEQGLAKQRGDLRKFMKSGGSIPSLPSGKQGVFHFSPYTTIAQLPCSSMLLQGVMNCSPDQVWRMIMGGGFGWERIASLFRADVESTTFLCRAFPKGFQAQRAFAGAVAPSMEVEQRTIELRGSIFVDIAQLNQKPNKYIVSQNQKYAQQLIDLGFGYFSESKILA